MQFIHVFLGFTADVLHVIIKYSLFMQKDEDNKR
jgi:hypothetical protein